VSVLINFETDRKALLQWKLEIAQITLTATMGDPITKFHAQSIIHEVTEQIKNLDQQG